MPTNIQNMKSSHILAAIKKSYFLLLILISNQIVWGQDLDSTQTDSAQTKEISTSPFSSYFTPLSQEEVQANFKAINTSGNLSDYKQVINTRELNGGRVTDPHFMMSAAGEDTLNAIIKMVEAETGFQMAVVCVNSIGDKDPTTWSHDLFNHWGIGEKGKDNGFLCVVIHDIRRVEFANGYGTEQVLTDLQGENIRQNEMIPYFKKDDYTTGIIRGMQAVADVFYGFPPDYFDYATDDNTNYDYGYDSYDDDYSSNSSFLSNPFIRIYALLAGILTLAFLICLAISFSIKDLHKRYHFLKFFSLIIFPIIFPIPFLAIYFIAKGLMNKWRNTERFSQTTGEFMIKLSEADDDKHLERGQTKEEIIASIDYDVWITQDESEVLVLAYKRWFSKFRKCPKCKYVTFYKEYDRVVVSATYSSSGSGERKYSCKNCSHAIITRYTIPKKVKSSSGGGGYSGGSSFSSGSSSGGGGGSSYGGGSSGGGGGGSSW